MALLPGLQLQVPDSQTERNPLCSRAQVSRAMENMEVGHPSSSNGRGMSKGKGLAEGVEVDVVVLMGHPVEVLVEEMMAPV